MVKIVPRRNESIQATLRRFRKLLEKEGIVKEIKRKAYYESPSEERSRNKRRIKREIEKEARKENSPPPTTATKKTDSRSSFNK
jgi:small subunit ribosomal protein S21